MTDKQTVYRIIDWNNHFENNRSRTLKYLDWVPVPTKQDGDGYTELVEHKDGAAHLGCWLAIVQVAARCQPRGTLLRSSGRSVRGTPMPHDCDSLSRMTRLPSKTLAAAIHRLCLVGWLERLTLTAQGLTAIRQDDAREVPDERQEGALHGTVRYGTEGHTTDAETTAKTTAPKPQRKTKKQPDPIWDTVVAEWYADGVPSSQIKAVGRIVSDFKQVKATPDAIRKRRQRIRETWGAGKDTARSTVAHWSEFSDGSSGVPPVEIPTEPQIVASASKKWPDDFKAHADEYRSLVGRIADDAVSSFAGNGQAFRAQHAGNTNDA